MTVGEQDFSPRLLAIQAEPPSPLPRVVLLTLVALVLGVIVWATVGRLDIVARANGKLISTSRLQVVQPLEGGRVEEILVNEGERVEAGQTLLVMDRQFTEADTAKLRAERDTTRAELLRVEAELAERELIAPDDSDPAVFARTLAAYRANREALQTALDEQRAVIERARQDVAAAEAVKEKLTATLPFYRENEVALETLAKSGNVNKLALLEKQKERIEVERDLVAQASAIRSLRAQIGEGEARQRSVTANYRRDLLVEQTQLAVALDKLEQDWNAQQYRNRLMRLTAPQAGFVQDLAVHTEGSVVPAGTVLLTLVCCFPH